MGKSINAMGSNLKTAPRLIALMSLQLDIPGRVALQQSPLALHQPRRLFNEGYHLNSKKHQTASVTLPNCLTRGVQSIPRFTRVVTGLRRLRLFFLLFCWLPFGIFI